MSTSPDCSAVKRCWAVSGTYFTLLASFRIAAAIALHTSTSRPDQPPWLSACEKPARPVFTPQASWPRDFTASSVLPANAGAATSAVAACAAQMGVDVRLMGAILVGDMGHCTCGERIPIT